MSTNAALARAIAQAFLAGQPVEDEMFDRAARLLGRRWRWLRSLTRRYRERFGADVRPTRREAVEFMLADAGLLRACDRHGPVIADPLAAPSRMFQPALSRSWNLPAIHCIGNLADWLDVSPSALDWFADVRGWEAKRARGPLLHYRYRTLSKRFGQVRLIEAPKPRLKRLQRKILAEALDRIPAHDAAHGFRCGRSIRTFAAPHVDKRVVLRLDLEDFFPSIGVARVRALFRTVGYPESVAELLAGLCTNSAPDCIWNDVEAALARSDVERVRRRYARPHLPQGAPTSPALANLCAYSLDQRLSALAASAGAEYTRYADDLAFSGDKDFERAANRFQLHAAAIVLEEGFVVHHRKTRIMRSAVRQRLAGLVVNVRPNVRRADYDRLKATLANCVRRGPDGQNRDRRADFRAHLVGRVAFVESVNPARGRRLRRLLERIEWRDDD